MPDGVTEIAPEGLPISINKMYHMHINLYYLKRSVVRCCLATSSYLMVISPAHAACVETALGSGDFNCSGPETITQDLSPPAGGVLNVTADPTFSTNVASGNGLTLSNSAGDGAITFMDSAMSSILAEDDGLSVDQSGTGDTEITVNGSIQGGNGSTGDDAITVDISSATIGNLRLTTGQGAIRGLNGNAVEVDHDGAGDIVVAIGSGDVSSAGESTLATEHEGTGNIIVETGSGAISSLNGDAVDVDHLETGDISVRTGSGAITSQTSDGIDIEHFGPGGMSLFVGTGSVVSNGGEFGDRAIEIDHRGTGEINVETSSGGMLSSNGGAIDIDHFGAGDISVISNAQISVIGADGEDSAGIEAAHTGPGDISIVSNGDITAGSLDPSLNSDNDMDAIIAAVSDGDLSITTQAGAVLTSFGDDGIDADVSGTSNVQIINNSDVFSSSIGSVGNGIEVKHTGTSGNIFVRNTGNIVSQQGNDEANGIEVDHDAALGSVVIVNEGAIRADTDGIDVAYRNGSGGSTAANPDIDITFNTSVVGGVGAGVQTATGLGGYTRITLNSGALLTTMAPSNAGVSGQTASGVALINDQGDSATTINTNASVVGRILLDDGSDHLTFSGGDFQSVTLMDGGDDADVADGFIDELTFQGVTATANGVSIVNWEVVSFQDSTMTANDLVAPQVNVCGGSTTLGGASLADDVDGCVQDDAIEITGTTVIANDIDGAGGSDTIMVSGDASVTGAVNGGGDGQDASAAADGGDNITIATTGSVGSVEGGAGQDAIDLLSGTIGVAAGGADADTIRLDGAAVTGSIRSGSGDDSFTWSSGTTAGFGGGAGSDTATVTAAEYDGTQLLDGGDDADVADGFIDELTLQGVTATANGASIVNWEVVSFQDSTMTANDLVAPQVNVCGGSTTLGGASLADDVDGCVQDDAIEITGTTVIANDIDGAGGSDTIMVSGDASVTGAVNGGGDGQDASAAADGGDNITIATTGSVGSVEGGAGQDAIDLLSGTIGVAAGGADADTIRLDGAAVTGSIRSGSGDDSFTWSSGTTAGFGGGAGSDTATVTAAEYDGTQLLDGGDDADVADGFIDELTFQGVTATANGVSIVNWEVVSFQDSTMTANDLVAPQVNVCGGSTTLGGASLADDVDGCVQDDAIEITGTTVIANDIDGAGGSDTIMVSGDASVTGAVNGGGDGQDASAAADGGDNITIATTGSVGSVEGGAGQDAIDLLSGTIGVAAGGADADTIRLDGAAVTGSIRSGSGDDSFTWSSGTTAGFGGGAGSDTATVTAAEYDGTQLLDGGDDADVADGFIDELTLQGVTATANGASIVNWEVVTLDNAMLAFRGRALTVGTGAGIGLFLMDGAVLDAAGGFALIGDLTNNALLTSRNGVVGDVISISGDYAGTGTIEIDVDFTNDITDKLAIGGDVTGGTTTISVDDVSTGTASRNDIVVVDVAGATAAGDFALDNGLLEVGPFAYDLNLQGSQWVLSAVAFSTNTAVQAAADAILLDVIEPLTFAQRTGLRNAYRARATVESFRQGQPEFLSQNLSAFRNSPEDQPGPWVVVFGDRLKEELSGSVNVDYQSTSRAIQAGVDFEVASGQLGHWVIGANGKASFIDATIDASRGTGELETSLYGMGAVATWYSSDGSTYFDAQAEVTWLSSDLSSSQSGDLAKSIDSTAYLVSGEIGHHLEIAKYSSLTPQAQLWFATIDTGSFTNSQGTRVDLGLPQDIVARLGLAYEYNHFDAAKERREMIYIAGSVLHNFDGKNTARIAGESLTVSGEDTWAEVGIGGLLSIDQTTSLFAEGAYRTALSGDISDNYGVSLSVGLRFAW